VARIFLDVLADMQHVTTPPFRELDVRQLHTSTLDNVVPNVFGALHLFWGHDEARHEEFGKPAPHAMPVCSGMDPVGQRPEIEDKGGIRDHFVKLVEEGNLWIKASVKVMIELREGVDITSVTEVIVEVRV